MCQKQNLQDTSSQNIPIVKNAASGVVKYNIHKHLVRRQDYLGLKGSNLIAASPVWMTTFRQRQDQPVHNSRPAMLRLAYAWDLALHALWQ